MIRLCAELQSRGCCGERMKFVKPVAVTCSSCGAFRLQDLDVIPHQTHRLQQVLLRSFIWYHAGNQLRWVQYDCSALSDKPQSSGQTAHPAAYLQDGHPFGLLNA